MIGDLLGLSLQPAAMIDTSGHKHQSCGHLGHLDTGQLDTGRSAGAGNNRYIGASCREGAHFYPRKQQ